MVDVTIRASFECGESKTKTIGPCDLAVFMGVSRKECGIKTQAAVVGGKISAKEMTFSLANMTVDVLLEMCEDSRERQARILKAYMESFIDAAAKKAGTSVMDKVAEQIEKDF